jgi:hypothetical protein
MTNGSRRGAPKSHRVVPSRPSAPFSAGARMMHGISILNKGIALELRCNFARRNPRARGAFLTKKG